MENIDNILVDLDSLSERNYFIPSYQRGYRWSKQQVDDLLNDVSDYLSNSGQGYYCLQPMVVKRLSDEDREQLVKKSLSDEEQYKLNEKLNDHWYEVIDGQQRLTTLALIRHYFNENYVGRQKKSEPTIKYETRDTHIPKVYINDNDDVVCDGIPKDSNIDLYHVVNAYIYIHDWFKNYCNSGGDENKIMSVFNKEVKVIWYEIDGKSGASTDAIELFTRINMGKIPLTNAELIKALFLRQRNFSDNQLLRQIEIAKEWDSIEYALQNDDLWYFLNNEGVDKPARIEYIFDMMYDSERQRAVNDGRESEFDKIYGTDSYKTFRFFAYKFKNDTAGSVKKYWEEVMGAFFAIKEWFSQMKYYHYIGYLIACDTKIVDIYTMYHNAPKDKFLNEIKNRIREQVKSVNCYKDKDGNVYIDLSYDKNKDLIKSVLLLFNIEYIVKHNSDSEHWYMRFPFDIYKKSDWDIEHINSFTTNEIQKTDDQVAWIDSALEDLKAIGKDIQVQNSKLYNDIEKFKKKPVSSSFQLLKGQIVELAGEYDSDEDTDTKNNIGNLTLLNADINRSYGNDLFISKRRKIIQEDKEGCFIPICTKNVFLKYFDVEGSSKTIWSKKNGDHAKYSKAIFDTLCEFINNKDVQHDEKI